MLLSLSATFNKLIAPSLFIKTSSFLGSQEIFWVSFCHTISICSLLCRLFFLFLALGLGLWNSHPLLFSVYIHSLAVVFFFKSHQRLVLYLLSLYWSYTRSPNISWVQFFFCLFNYILSICSWISNRYLILNMSKIRPLIPNPHLSPPCKFVTPPFPPKLN